MSTLLMVLRFAAIYLPLLTLSLPAIAGGLAPGEALARMRVPANFNVQLVASEPDIRQPVAIYFDERGRMWVVQYLQYPTPAGLKPVQVDQYLRTRYDKVPEPPPFGPKGADRITICEDTDGDGKADRFKDFVTGLNLATGMAIGYGGVFVAQSPYLLFYPDRNGDDIPDGPPEVLLAGFGMEDAHAFPNSLQWGPDGWLYGAQGSTVTAHIRGIEFQQGIWRYHPITRKFELFAEGGGNTWGLDFDEHGNVIAGTNFGEVIALHQVQGGYYVKTFAKHGDLHNPYAFGYFGHIPYTGFKGGHVTCGGIIYDGGSFPATLSGAYIAANVLANAVYWHIFERDGSSFKAHFGGELLTTDDIWFRPVDCQTGPDGAVYVADWYDKRATHVDPADTWDRSNGRVYKVQAKGGPVVAPFNLAAKSSRELVRLLGHRNDWFRREARRILAERRDAQIVPSLKKMVLTASNPNLALQALWALYVSGGFDQKLAEPLLTHPVADLRAWTVRLLADFPGEPERLSPAIEKLLIQTARSDPSPGVRNQLACMAKRLPGEDALPIVRELIQRDEDAKDPQIPLLIWWALEHKSISHLGGVLDLFSKPEIWQHPIVPETLASRLARRYASETNGQGLEACARLLRAASSDAASDSLINGMNQALAGHAFAGVPVSLEFWFGAAWPRLHGHLPMLELALRFRCRDALAPAMELLTSNTTHPAERLALIEILGQIKETNALPELEKLVSQKQKPALAAAALNALQQFPQPEIADRLIGVYPNLPPEVKARTRTALASRTVWAAALIRAVQAGKIPAADLSLEQIRQIAAHDDHALNQFIARQWGKIQPLSPAEKQSFINQTKLLLRPSGVAGRTGKGDAAEGHKIFVKTCGVCHKLFGEGASIGPDLTGADRRDLDALLLNIVNPSFYIRPEFVAWEATTRDDQSFTGLLVESTPSAVTLLDRNNQRHLIARQDLQNFRESSLSLMPEGLLEGLKQQEIIDLFTYLQSDLAEADPKLSKRTSRAP